MTTPSLFPERDRSLCSFCDSPALGFAFRPLHALGPVVPHCLDHTDVGYCRHASASESCPCHPKAVSA